MWRISGRERGGDGEVGRRGAPAWSVSPARAERGVRRGRRRRGHGRREHELGEEAERWRGGGGGRLMRTGAVHRGAEEATRGRTRGGEEAARRRGARRSGGHGLGEEG